MVTDSFYESFLRSLVILHGMKISMHKIYGTSVSLWATYSVWRLSEWQTFLFSPDGELSSLFGRLSLS